MDNKMKMALCYRCLYYGMTRPGKKHKQLSKEASKKILMCGKCKCQTFIS